MKRAVIFVYVCLAAAHVLGGSLYGEKEDAVEAVTKRFDELTKTSQSLLNKISNEKSKTDPDEENSAKEEGETQKTKALSALSEESLSVTRTGIVKGKPLSSFDCIKRTEMKGEKEISEIYDVYIKAVENVEKTRTDVLEFQENEVKLILKASEQLKSQSIEKLQSAKTGFQSIKTEALSRIDASSKRFSEIDIRVSKLNLKEDYTAIKLKLQNQYKENTMDLAKRLQKCIA